MQEEFTIFIPNTFTPNNDEFNHQLVSCLNGIEYFNFEMKIYNRWGQIVFVTNDKNQFWDGTYNGKNLPIGTYYYIIDLGDESVKPFTGPITILR